LQNAYDNSLPLKNGETGDGVRIVQWCLRDLGYAMPVSFRKSGDADGIFGNETFRTIQDFQKDNGLGVDGIAGRETLDRLDKLFMEKTPGPNTIPPNEWETPPRFKPPKGWEIPPKFEPPGGWEGPVKRSPPKQPVSLCGSGKTELYRVIKNDVTFVLCEDAIEHVFVGLAPLIVGRRNSPNVVYYVGGAGASWGFDDAIATGELPTVYDPITKTEKEKDPEGIFKNYDIGFIQTIDPNFILAAMYTNNWKAARAIPVSRDAFNETTPEPWYNPKTVVGQASGPIDMEDHTTPGGRKPFFGDRPQASFPIRLPEENPCGNVNIQQFNAVGTFHIWLIIMPNYLPLSIDNLFFLKHFVVSVDQNASLKIQGDPKVPVDWNITNSSRLALKEFGKGSTNPVLTGTIANFYFRHLFVIPGWPCTPVCLP
jgi:hypothetical protein